GHAAPRPHHGLRARPRAEDLVRDAGVCQGRQGRLLLPGRAEVQVTVRDHRLQRRGEARRRGDVADGVRADGADARRRGEEQGAGQASRELKGYPSMSEFLTHGHNFQHVLALLILIGRVGDIGSTYLATPRLTLEANPFVRRLRWPFGVVSLGLCLVPYY